MITDFQDMRVTVMGLGTFGGGVGATRFLVRRGACVTVTDLRTADSLKASIRSLSPCAPACWRLGEHHPEDFEGADLIVASPAVSPDNPWLERARRAGVPVTTEMNLFWERNPGRVIGITGSNGKSTTTALIHRLLSQTHRLPDAVSGEIAVEGQSSAESARVVTRPDSIPRVWLGGNIGQSLLPVVHQILPGDWVVLELSSFQLESLASLHPNPHLAVVTNFSPNHLDRHGTLERYRTAKRQLLQWQTPDRFAVLNSDDPDVSTWPTAARVVRFGMEDRGGEGLFRSNGPCQTGSGAVFRFKGEERLFPIGEWLSLPGNHNFQNALAATAAALTLEIEPRAVESGMRGFRGLPHRLELVAEHAGRRFYNDSKATTPEAAALALQSFTAPIVLLAGGYDKEIDLSPLVSAIFGGTIRAVALLGQTGPRLEQLLAARDPTGRVVRCRFADFRSAFDWAVAQSTTGDVVLLSPGCASYDWFENYEARGSMFRDFVQEFAR